MANKIKGFATNNLVEGHDNYVKFMKKRWDYIKNEGEPTEVLFCKRGLVTEAFKINTKEDQMKLNILNKDLTLWHCIVLSYDIWYDCVKDCVEEGHGSIGYKKFVNVPDDILRKFKYRFDQSVKNAKCDHKRYTNPDQRNCLNACRYLARFWTYLDLAKDCKTQRFFPNAATIKRAAKIFGYGSDENPFIMNGKFRKNAVRSNSEKKENVKMADTTNCFTIEDLDFSQRTCNLLKRAYINTLDDILKKTYLDLICIRGLGKHEANEIVEKLKELGYEYKDTESVPQLVKTPTETFDKNKLLIDIIEDRRLTNPLHRASIHTVGDFLSMSDKELLKIRTFGVAKLKKVKEIVNNYVKTTKEESVIDIAEKAAEEIEEKRRVDPMLSLCKNDEYEELRDIKKKYDELLKTAQKQADMYDELLKQKLDLDAYVPRLKDDIAVLKEKNQELKELNSNLNIAANPKNLDTFALLNTVLEKMKDSKMEYILLTIDGMSIDIHPAKSFPLRTSYQIRSN